MAEIRLKLDEAVRLVNRLADLPKFIAGVRVEDERLVATVQAGPFRVPVGCRVVGYSDEKLRVRLDSSFSAHRILQFIPVLPQGFELTGDVLTAPVPGRLMDGAFELRSLRQDGDTLIAQIEVNES